MSTTMYDGRSVFDLPLIVSRFDTAMPKGPAFGTAQPMSWGGLTEMLRTRREGEKDGDNIVLARFNPEPDGRVRRLKQKVSSRTCIGLDVESNKSTGEVPPPIDVVISRLAQQGWAAAIYTSHNHTAAAPRYRVLLPLSAEIAPMLPAVEVVSGILGLDGVLDTSKLGAASVFYLPSAAPGKSAGHCSKCVDGDPIDADWMKAKADTILGEREATQAAQRAEALRESEKRRAARVRASGLKGLDTSENLIEAIRDRLDLEGELLRHGYKKVVDRFLYPGSETGIPGVHILCGGDGVERAFSHHSGDPLAAANLPSWCTVKAIDAVDVVTILDFGCDRTKALHEMAKRFGIGDQPKRSAPEEPAGFPDIPPLGENEAGGKPASDEKADAGSAGDKRSSRGPHVLTPSKCAIEAIRPYVVKGLLSRGDHGALIGLPGSGKSVAAPYLGYRVALGLDVFGFRTKPMTVLYIAAEDGGGMKLRIRALFERLGDAPNFLLQPVPVDFLNSQSGDVAAIERLIEKHRPGLVIVDTVARAFPGLKENDPDEMGRVVKVSRGFTVICDSAVLSLHHPPKDSITPRGHSVLNGDLDVTLYLEGSGRGPRQVTMGKNRNGPSDTVFGFGLGVHTLDGLLDADGDAVTAPVAEPLDGAATPRNAAKEARLKDQPAILLRELRTLIDQEGTMVQPSVEFPLVRAVTRAVLRRRLIDRAWFSDDLLSIVESKPPKLDRKAYGVEANAFKPLKRQGFVGFTQDWVWLL